MKIVCPHCLTDYAVTKEILGPSGRKVRCAKCTKVWHAVIEEEKPPVQASPVQETVVGDELVVEDAFTNAAEGFADFASDEVEIARSALQASRREDGEVWDEDEFGDAVASGPVDAGSGRNRKKGKVRLKGRRLQSEVMAAYRERFIKVMTPVTIAVGFAALIVAAPQRDAVVRMVPDLAGLYELVGLDVNVRGVEFSEFTAQRDIVSGLPILRIEGSMINTRGEDVPLSPIRLALLSENGTELFAWRVEPAAIGLMPGQMLPIASELTAPPETVASVAVRFMQDGERLPGEDF